jgi:uncharacterized membrane protein
LVLIEPNANARKIQLKKDGSSFFHILLVLCIRPNLKIMKTFRSLLFILVTFLLVPSLAHAEYFDIPKYKSDIVLDANGTFEVTENINVLFTEPRHGIYRDIDTQGLTIEVQNVKDENGQDWNYALEPFGEGTRVKIGEANTLVDGMQVYRINYLVRKGIGFFNDHDELYWNVTGNAWPVQIKAAETSIKLPDSVKGSEGLKFICYTGAYMSSEQDCKYVYDENLNTVTFTANSLLPEYSGMTVAVWMPVGTFKKPSTLEVKTVPANSSVWLNGNYACDTDCTRDDLVPGEYNVEVTKFGYTTPENQKIVLAEGVSQLASFDLKIAWWYSLMKILLAVLGFAIAFEPIITFYRKGRDPRGRGTIVPQYEAPDELSPAEMGTLYDEKADIKDIIAAIIDLCVRGYLTIKVLPKAEGLIFKQDDYELQKTDKPKPGDKGLSKFETKLLDAIFSSAKTKKISDLKNKFYTHLPDLTSELYDGLVDKGYFPKNPNSTRGLYLVKGIVFIFISFWVIPFLIFLVGGFLPYSLAINGFLSLVFFSYMPKKTTKGVEAYEHILGFKTYIETAEKDRLKFQENENTFYKILPFAMTLNVADKWSNAFKNVFKQPPNWYQGGGTGPFHPNDFVHHLGSVSSSMSSTFRSQPSSSGHSGGGGFSGGSSGGGGGGGGGGSW